MKGSAVIVAMAAALALNASAGPEQIIKQRAKDFRDQHNAGQGPPPNAPPRQTPAAPTPPPQAAAPSPAVTAQQQSVAKIKVDFSAFKPGAEITADQKLQLTKDLLAAAQGATKPSQASVTKLVNDLSAALSGKTLSATDQSHLAEKLAAIFNGAQLQSSQMQGLTLEVQSILQSSGVKRNNALPVVADLKAIAAELQKPKR